jgi:glycosyltransferase involved in cell wall biosynthesis
LRVGLDISIQGRRHPTGVERAQVTLIDALLDLDVDHELHLLTNATAPERWCEHPRVVLHSSSVTPTWPWRELVVPQLVRSARLALVHSPVVALARAVACPQVATVHELPWAGDGSDLGDGSWRHRLALARAARRAAALVCVSRRTADQLIDLHPACAERVLVLNHGVDPSFAPDPRAVPPSRRGRSVLAVGRLRAKKNLSRLLEALSLVPEAQLVIAGPPGDASEQLTRRAMQADLAGRVQFVGYLDDAALIDAYHAARCVAFPSLFEGFGLPVIEAMALGTPVIAARQGAVPEALGDAALLFDGHSTVELASSLRRLLDDDSLADLLAERGRAHAATRDAADVARAVVSLWERLE